MTADLPGAILSRIPRNELERLREGSKRPPSSNHGVTPWDLEWWNVKFYKRTDNHNGNCKQENLHGHREVPNKRRPFHPSKDGRFSLESDAVAYFCSEWLLATTETTVQFRQKENLSFLRDLDPYLDGKSDPDLGRYGFPLAFRLQPNAVILDLRDRSRPFFRLCAEHGKLPADLLECTIMAREPESHLPTTRAIAEIVRGVGFDGILYRSVRQPLDASLCGSCLVMFSEDKVRRG